MLTLGWIGALALLTTIFSRWENHQINPNTAPDSLITGQTTQVTLTANRQHHYLADGTINQQPVTFLLDTGATTVSVPAHMARKLGLKRGTPMTSSTANGDVTVHATMISQIKLGDIEFHNVRGSINPGMKDDAILLGMSALKQVEWRQKADQLTLIQQRE